MSRVQNCKDSAIPLPKSASIKWNQHPKWPTFKQKPHIKTAGPSLYLIPSGCVFSTFLNTLFWQKGCFYCLKHLHQKCNLRLWPQERCGVKIIIIEKNNNITAHQSHSWVLKAALSGTVDILVALAALVLLYWPVLVGGQSRCVRSKTSILGPLKMKTWQALSCAQIRGVFLDICPIHYKGKEEVLDGTEHTWLEDTNPCNISKKRNGNRKHACTWDRKSVV